MDASRLYPKGYHYARPSISPTGTDIAYPRRRRELPEVKYYITDFGMSTRFENGDSTRLVTGSEGQDKSVPELSDTVPYDPFAVDVYTLGNVYKETLLEPYVNLSFLAPLIESMTREDPKARPRIDEAIADFNRLLSQQPSYRLRWRLKHKESSAAYHLYQDIRSLGREAVYIAKRILAAQRFRSRSRAQAENAP